MNHCWTAAWMLLSLLAAAGCSQERPAGYGPAPNLENADALRNALSQPLAADQEATE